MSQFFHDKLSTNSNLGFIRLLIVTLTVIGAAGGQSTPALAQAISNQDLNTIQREQNRIINREEQRRERLDEENRRRSNEPPVIEGVPDVPGALPPTDQCHDVGSVNVTGVTLLSEHRIKQITAPFENRCLGLDEINEILRSITNAYVDAGYVTSRAYVPAQDLTSGTLEIVVVEGLIEGLGIENPEIGDGWRTTMAFPGMVGEPLNLRDIEQGLDQMNRLKSVTAKMKLVPGSEQGASNVVIEEVRTRPFHFTLGRDNTGSASTGENQHYITFEADNTLRLNDYFSVQFKGDVLGETSRRDSESIYTYLAIPYGYWTFSATASHFRYNNVVEGTNQSFDTSGSSKTYKGTVSRRLHRDADSKTDFDVSLTHKIDRNFIGDVLLDTSTRRQTIVGLELGHQRRALGGAIDVSAGYDIGTLWLKTKKDVPFDGGAPQAQFRKGTLDLSYRTSYPTDPVTFGYSLSASGQVSRDELYSGQQIGIGGLYSVRGFKEETLTGDTGGYVQNEISMTGNLPEGRFRDIFGFPSLYAAFDIGALHPDKNNDDEAGVMKGWVVGLRSSGGYLTFDLSYARPVSSPSHITEQHHEVYFSTAVNF